MLRTGEDGILLPASAGECSQAIYRLDIGVRRIAQQGRFVFRHRLAQLVGQCSRRSLYLQATLLIGQLHPQVSEFRKQ